MQDFVELIFLPFSYCGILSTFMLWDFVLWDFISWDFVRRDFVLWDFVLWDSVPDSFTALNVPFSDFTLPF